MPIQCPVCKATLDDDSKFCLNCGAKLSQELPVSQTFSSITMIVSILIIGLGVLDLILNILRTYQYMDILFALPSTLLLGLPLDIFSIGLGMLALSLAINSRTSSLSAPLVLFITAFAISIIKSILVVSIYYMPDDSVHFFEMAQRLLELFVPIVQNLFLLFAALAVKQKRNSKL